MKPHNVVFGILLFLCIAISVAETTGALAHLPWVSNHIPDFTLVTLGLLGFYAITTHVNVSQQLRSLGKRIEETSQLSMQDKCIISLFADFWKQTDKDSEGFFQELGRKLKSGKRADLRFELDSIYREIAAGNFFGTTVPCPFDFTIVAVDSTGVVLYHPDPKTHLHEPQQPAGF